MRKLTPLLLGFCLTALACGGSSSTDYGSNSPAPPPPPMPSGNNVNVQNNFFSPGQLNVTAGANVTWTWYSYGTTHHILFEDGENSQAQSSGTYERTFAAAGTYRYRCTYHSDNFGSGMIGSVVVQ